MAAFTDALSEEVRCARTLRSVDFPEPLQCLLVRVVYVVDKARTKGP